MANVHSIDISEGCIVVDSSDDSSSQEEQDKYVLEGKAANFLSGVQEGPTGAREILVKFKDDKEMYISSTVLSNVGKYFQVMLDCGLREALENKVTLPTVTQSTFIHLMDFTLGETVRLATREELLELLKAAHMMQIQSLVDDCTELLQATTTANNCLETFSMVRRLQLDKVNTIASSVVLHMTRVIESDEWCSLQEEDIGILLKTWATGNREPSESAAFAEVFHALLRWIEKTGVDQETATRLLGLMDSSRIQYIHKDLPDNSCLLKNSLIKKAVQEWLKPRGEFTLLVVSSPVSKGDDFWDVYCWSENRQNWYKFPSTEIKLHNDLAVTRYGNIIFISGRIGELAGPSQKSWWQNWGGVTVIQVIATARSKHGMVVVGEYVYIVGGLPGPMKSVQRMNRILPNEKLQDVGELAEAVYDCGVAAVKNKLIVVGGCSSEGPRNIIQTFHTVSGATEVITLPESLGLQLDLGFTRHIGTLDSLLFLSRSGHLLEVKVERSTVTLQSPVLLKDFHHQSPFAAVLDSGGVVVCDRRSADCRYSLDGEKKEEMTVVSRSGEDIHVHGVFRFFLRLAAPK